VDSTLVQRGAQIDLSKANASEVHFYDSSHLYPSTIFRNDETVSWRQYENRVCRTVVRNDSSASTCILRIATRVAADRSLDDRCRKIADAAAGAAERVALDFQDAGNGKWSTKVDIVDQNGGTMQAEAILPLDGTPGPVSGNYWANVSAMKMPAPNMLVMQLVDHGTPASTRVYSVSDDGKLLTETKAFFSKDGNPVLQTTTFTREP
jgi:hypothetical protein